MFASTVTNFSPSDDSGDGSETMNSVFWDHVQRSARPGTRAFHVAMQQPSWVTRLAMTVFILAIALPFLLLLIFAALLSAVVFGALSIGNSIIRALTPGRRTHDIDTLRQNVRVRGPGD